MIAVEVKVKKRIAVEVKVKKRIAVEVRVQKRRKKKIRKIGVKAGAKNASVKKRSTRTRTKKRRIEI